MRFLLACWLVIALTAVSAPVRGQQHPDDRSTAASQNRQSGSYLGVGVTDVDATRIRNLDPDSDTGVQILHVREGSPADKAGLRVGDILLSYNGENILGARQLGRLVSETPAGRRVKLKLWRDGVVQNCAVTTAAAPEGTSDLQANMRELSEKMGGLRFSLPMDIPSPLLIWRNRLLGIVVESLDPQLAEYFGVKEGVLVRLVEKGSPADAAGMRSGDVLTSVGAQMVSNPRDLSICIRNQTKAKQVSVSLMRNHKALRLSISPAEYPQ